MAMVGDVVEPGDIWQGWPVQAIAKADEVAAVRKRQHGEGGKVAKRVRCWWPARSEKRCPSRKNLTARTEIKTQIAFFLRARELNAFVFKPKRIVLSPSMTARRYRAPWTPVDARLRAVASSSTLASRSAARAAALTAAASLTTAARAAARTTPRRPRSDQGPRAPPRRTRRFRSRPSRPRKTRRRPPPTKPSSTRRTRARAPPASTRAIGPPCRAAHRRRGATRPRPRWVPSRTRRRRRRATGRRRRTPPRRERR